MWCEIRRQAVKKKEYEKCIEKVDNEKMKEALIQAFDKDFPRIIELCDDDYTVVQIFVSLFEMLGEKGNAYKNLLESFHDLDEEDKLEEIIKGVFELRDFLEIVNKKYDENNEMLDVLEVTDTDEFSDKLDVIYSYVTSIKEEVAKLFEIANSYSKSFDI